jgi:hypothetical protein
MQSKATTINEYIAELPEERQATVLKLHRLITTNLPKGFEAIMNYGMIGYVVPHNLYPSGYHCDPKLPLPFAGLASQKGAISFYHMGIYADNSLLEWFQHEYAKRIPYKLDMGKSCIRFKNESRIPFELIADLMQKMSVKAWIELYEKNIRR